MLKKYKDNILSKVESKVESVKPMVIPQDATLSDCKLIFEKEYKFIGQQYQSWINESIPRTKVLAKMKSGDAIDFRPAMWDNGTLFLCIHRKTGLDFGVLVNNIARKLQHEYYGCYMVGQFLGNDKIHVQVYQPPEYL